VWYFCGVLLTTEASCKRVTQISTIQVQGSIEMTFSLINRDITSEFNFKVCEHSTQKLNQLLIHIQIHGDGEKFDCPYPDCSYTANAVRKLYFHRRTKVWFSLENVLKSNSKTFFFLKAFKNKLWVSHLSEKVYRQTCESHSISRIFSIVNLLNVIPFRAWRFIKLSTTLSPETSLVVISVTSALNMLII